MLDRLPGSRKLALLLYFTSDKTLRGEKPENNMEYTSTNIFSFLGDSRGLHPISEFQKEQEDKLLNYIFA